MIRTFNGKTPKIAASAWISEAAYVVGDVEIGENTNVWPGVVIRGDLASIKIGNDTVIQDNCVIHSGSPYNPPGDAVIGDRVHMGHGAIVNCRRIGDNVLIGMNATLLHDCDVGSFCVVAAGCVIMRGMKVPDRSFITGIPGVIQGPASAHQLQWVQHGPQKYVELARQYKEQGL